MATNVTIYDLVNYPGTSKTVTIDLKSVVNLGDYGDESFVLTCYTSATASGSASIQDVFVDKLVLGYSISNGFNSGPYTISALQRNLQVSIDGSAWRAVSLTPSAIAIAGSSIAADLQSLIRALAATGELEADNLAFRNASLSFSDGRFYAKSGNMAGGYTGTGKSSFRVTTGATLDVASHLGFLGAVESEVLNGTSVSETYASFAYTVSSGTTLPVNDGTLATANIDCIGITDGTNTEYRLVTGTAAGTMTISSAFSNNYAANSRIQVLRMQSPVKTCPSVQDSVDDAMRFAIDKIINQVDFSS
jgi:hypothetical protein